MGRERSSNPILNSLTRIYRFRLLVHCVTNISYWLPLNEGFRCNCIKTNKYVIFVVCTSDQVKWSICDIIFERKRGDNSTINRVCMGYRIFKTKELSFIGSGLFFPHEYTGKGRDAEKFSIFYNAQFFCLKCTVSNLYNNWTCK